MFPVAASAASSDVVTTRNPGGTGNLLSCGIVRGKFSFVVAHAM